MARLKLWKEILVVAQQFLPRVGMRRPKAATTAAWLHQTVYESRLKEATILPILISIAVQDGS
jgi:predicted metal-dependent HD superfamily phosphohydrolase